MNVNYSYRTGKHGETRAWINALHKDRIVKQEGMNYNAYIPWNNDIIIVRIDASNIYGSWNLQQNNIEDSKVNIGIKAKAFPLHVWSMNQNRQITVTCNELLEGYNNAVTH